MRPASGAPDSVTRPLIVIGVPSRTPAAGATVSETSAAEAGAAATSASAMAISAVRKLTPARVMQGNG